MDFLKPKDSGGKDQKSPAPSPKMEHKDVKDQLEKTEPKKKHEESKAVTLPGDLDCEYMKICR